MFYLTHILQPLFVSFVVAHVAFILGRLVATRIEFLRTFSATSIGISFLIGYGLLGYVAVILSLFAPLTKIIIWVVIASIVLIGKKSISELYKYVHSRLSTIRTWRNSEKVFLILILAAFLFYLTSAFVPPYRIDALAYHIPETMQIAEKGIWQVGGIGNFFGNQPLLVETIYAPLYVISGFTAMNMAHYAILISACIALFGLLQNRFGRLPGLLSVLGVFSIYELLVNATSPYVDAATVSFEVIGILLFMEWAFQQRRDVLIASGFLYGFALSTKHLPMYSLLILAVLFIAVHISKKYSFKIMLLHAVSFAVPLFLASGFWYIKSFILTGNPIYPFIFGHVGFTDEIIQSLNIAVQQFGSRSLLAYVVSPYTFFLHPLYVHVLGSFFLLPFVFFIRKNRAYARVLMLITIAYFSIWFFFISHQRRFVMTGIVLLVVCISILCGNLFSAQKMKLVEKYAWPGFALFLIIVCSGVFFFRDNYYIQAKGAELAYVAGIDSTEQFYQKRGMGPIYSLSSYINNNLKDEQILNLWADQIFFLRNNNSFVGPEAFIRANSEINTTTFANYLRHDKITYVSTMSEAVIQVKLNDPYFKTNPAEQDYYRDVVQYVIEIERVLPLIADVIYAGHDRILYRVK